MKGNKHTSSAIYRKEKGMRPNQIFHGNEKPTNAVEGDCWYRDGELLVFKNDWERCVDIDEAIVNNIQ